MNLVYIVSGPTSSGKTEYAVKLARHLKYNCETISADSRQVYKGMTIGTGAPKLKNGFYRGVRHHVIGIVEPNRVYSVFDFQKDAHRLIEQIQKRGKVPVVVGGTGLWIRALKEGLNFQQTKPDLKLRKRLEQELKKKGLKYLARRLKALRRAHGDNSHFDLNNPRRVIRALEIVLQKQNGGHSRNMRSHKMRIEQNAQTPYTFKAIHLSPSKKLLYRRINKRVDEMVRNGLVMEVIRLLKKYHLIRERPSTSSGTKYFLLPERSNAKSKGLLINEFKLNRYPALTGIGYREIIDYLQGKTALPEAIELIKLHTRQYAKRQITWFKKFH